MSFCIDKETTWRWASSLLGHIQIYLNDSKEGYQM